GDLSKWDVSKVTNMDSMFKGCENFNGDLSKWGIKDTSR
ncbi:BspA family leucine-rich repeat surface protein, partial [Campylobacter coli]